MHTENTPEMLRSLAQNDYMIDGKYLPAGEKLIELANKLESAAKREASDDEKYERLQDIGKSAAESLRDMVAALECDYDRLEELREERADMEGWLVKCDNGTYDARNPATDDEGYDYHNLGDGKTKESALKALYLAHCPDDAEELAALEEAAGDCESREDAEQRIQEDPLSVQVRSGWYAPGENNQTPEEFEILLSTGGPATRIIGELDASGTPDSARLQTQDWGTPWTDYNGNDDMPYSKVCEICLTYAQQFYFGEG